MLIIHNIDMIFHNYTDSNYSNDFCVYFIAIYDNMFIIIIFFFLRTPAFALKLLIFQKC